MEWEGKGGWGCCVTWLVLAATSGLDWLDGRQQTSCRGGGQVGVVGVFKSPPQINCWMYLSFLE